MKDTEKSDHNVIKKKANKILKNFSSEGIKIHESSYLYKLLTSTINNFSEKNTPYEVFDALFVNRLYNGIMFIEKASYKKKFLRDLLNGTLSFQDREHSHAKNILFELELAQRFSKKFKKVELAEPDIVVNLTDDKVGIACKKITSMSSVQKHLSKAVKQIKLNGFNFGIVAINIDNLTPENSILKIEKQKDALMFLHKFNMDFIKKNERHFFKYLTNSRIIAILVESSVIADIPSSKPKFNNLTQTTMWTISDLEDKLKEKVNKFRILEK